MAKRQSDGDDGGGGARPKGRRDRVGYLPPRYKFLLNPFPETRLSTCPKCDGLTYPRNFPC